MREKIKRNQAIAILLHHKWKSADIARVFNIRRQTVQNIKNLSTVKELQNELNRVL